MSEIRKVRFKGHESFTLREGWLNKGLFEVNKNARVFSVNFGADALGVGPNMAKAIRYWLRCAGLTYDVSKQGTFLTETGSLILQKDPYVEEWFTLWLIHCRIAANRELATAWNLFFNEFCYEEFDRGQMVAEMKQLANHAAGEKQVASRSVEGDCDAIIHMYVKKGDKGGTPEEKNVSPFGRLGLLTAADGIFSRSQPGLNHLPREIVHYLLASCFTVKTGETMDGLLEAADGPGKLLHLKRMAFLELLEKLEADQKITINRTAGLNMVYPVRKVPKEEIVRDYYGRH